MSNPDTPTSFSQLPHASVGRRLAALVYDALIVMGLLMVYGFVAMLVASAVVGLNCQPEALDYNPCVSGPLFQLGALAVIVSYFVWSWRAAGQTIGMRAWRLLLASSNGLQLSWRQCALRCLPGAFPLLAMWAGYWQAALVLLAAAYMWGLARADLASWHDIVSGSEVRLLPKKKK